MPRIVSEENDLKRFHESYTIVDDCWIWAGTIARTGYGVFGMRYKHFYAHRASLILHKIPISDGHDVRHKCPKHLRHCVNPAHLTTGTRTENNHDKIADGTLPIGESHQNSKLTEAQVLEIRASEMSNSELFRKFNVSQATICDIIARRTWKHI